MSVYPVILCGGPGERLWPASRPERPKPFLRLAGPRSGFQEAVLRAAPLADGGEVLVLGVAANADLIAEQLAEIGIHAAVLLEPVGRNTGPAVAAAAAWIAARSAAAIAVIVPADHHLPDAHAFQEAVRSTFPAAEAGAVVTLGMRPTAANTAYGYIRPGEGAGPVKPIAAFVEKPDAARAATLIAEGALWNSGTFVATAATLLEELGRHAPEGPALAFDRAVMEKTDRGAVLPVAFAWSDLGSWAAVWAAAGPAGAAAPMAPASIGPPPARFASLEAAASWLTAWLGRAALPLWATAGVDAGNRGFREALTWLGAPHDPRRRARVQARQAFVFATAAAEGFEGPGRLRLPAPPRARRRRPVRQRSRPRGPGDRPDPAALRARVRAAGACGPAPGRSLG